MDEERKSLFEQMRHRLRAMLVKREGHRGDSPEDGEPHALVGAPLTPRPHLNSGAVALPEPDDADF
jgi:hypothetical protein